MAKDNKKGVYEDAEALGKKEKSSPHSIDSIYENAEQEGKKNVSKQDSFMKPDGQELVKKAKVIRAKKVIKEEGIYEEAGELAKKEGLKSAGTDSIYKQAEILGEQSKEEIDDFMTEPKKK